MRPRADQGAGRGRGLRLFALLLAALAPPQSRSSTAAGAPVEPASRGALVAECDVLLGAAVKTPYGWGWKGDARPPAPRSRGRSGRGAPATTIDVRRTAAAGLALHLAGRALDEPRFTRAAAQAARSLAAVQSNTGQLPAAGVIGANAGGRDAPMAVPSRDATCAALGLFLAIAHDSGADDRAADGPTRRAAVQAAHWLATQQTRGGGWLGTEPPDAPPGEGVKGVRLDRVGYRDATIALCLAARVLDDERLRRGARAAAADLRALRVEDENSAAFHLWATAYAADRTALASGSGRAPAVDTLASRNATQALLMAGVLVDDEGAIPPLREAAAALTKLPHENGTWRRRYDGVAPETPLHPANAAADPDGGQAPVSELFRPDDAQGTEGGESETVSGVDTLVRAVGRLDELGAEGFRRSLADRLDVEHRAALLLCGLGDDAITADGPPSVVDPAGGGFPGRLRRIVAMTRAVIGPAVQGKGGGRDNR